MDGRGAKADYASAVVRWSRYDDQSRDIESIQGIKLHVQLYDRVTDLCRPVTPDILLSEVVVDAIVNFIHKWDARQTEGDRVDWPR